MFTIPSFLTQFDGETTKHGINRLDFMIKMLQILEARPSKMKSNFNKLKSFLVQQLKRGITVQEELKLSQGIADYIISDPATNERSQSMEFLFNCEFLE